MNLPWKSKICRLCLESDAMLLDAFQVKEEINFQLRDAIEELLQLVISEDGFYPSTVCTKCICILRDFKDYKRMVIKCNKALDILLQNAGKGLVSNVKLDRGVTNSCSDDGCHSTACSDQEEDTNFTLFLDSSSEDEVDSTGALGDECNNSGGDGSLLLQDVRDDSSCVNSIGDVPESSSVEEIVCGGQLVGNTNPMLDPPMIQSGEGIPHAIPKEPETPTQFKSLRRSLRVRRSSYYSKCENEPVALESMQTVGKVKRTSSRLEAKALYVKERTRSQVTLDFNIKGAQGKQRRGRKGVRDDQLLPQGTEVEDEEILKQSQIKKASLTEAMRDKYRVRDRERKRKYYQSLNEEERRIVRIQRKNACRNRVSLMTEEERKEYTRHNCERQRRYRASMSDEVKEEWRKIHREKKRKYIASLSGDKKEEFREKNRLYVQRHRDSCKMKNFSSSAKEPVS